MDTYKLIAVGLGGMLGSLGRFITVQAVDRRLNSVFPYGTLTVNILGSFILGLVYTLALRKAGISENWRLFLGAGFCGGFTTFSAFAWENFSLLEQRLTGTSLVYVSASLAAGFFALLAGVWLGRFL